MTTQTLKTLDDKQYSYDEAIKLSEKLEKDIRVRISPDDFEPKEFANFYFEEEEVFPDELIGKAYNDVVETSCTYEEGYSEDYSEDDELYDLLNAIRNETDMAIYEILDDLKIEHTGFKWGGNEPQYDTVYRYFDAEEFKKQARTEYSGYVLPGGFQRAQQTAKDFGYVDIVKVDCYRMAYETALSGQNNFTNDAWARDLDDLKSEINDWVNDEFEYSEIETFENSTEFEYQK